jgi:hypothetical protein
MLSRFKQLQFRHLLRVVDTCSYHTKSGVYGHYPKIKSEFKVGKKRKKKKGLLIIG